MASPGKREEGKKGRRTGGQEGQRGAQLYRYNSIRHTTYNVHQTPNTKCHTRCCVLCAVQYSRLLSTYCLPTVSTPDIRTSPEKTPMPSQLPTRIRIWGVRELSCPSLQLHPTFHPLLRIFHIILLAPRPVPTPPGKDGEGPLPPARELYSRRRYSGGSTIDRNEVIYNSMVGGRRGLGGLSRSFGIYKNRPPIAPDYCYSLPTKPWGRNRQAVQYSTVPYHMVKYGLPSPIFRLPCGKYAMGYAPIIHPKDQLFYYYYHYSLSLLVFRPQKKNVSSHKSPARRRRSGSYTKVWLVRIHGGRQPRAHISLRVRRAEHRTAPHRTVQ